MNCHIFFFWKTNFQVFLNSSDVFDIRNLNYCQFIGAFIFVLAIDSVANSCDVNLPAIKQTNKIERKLKNIVRI